MLPLAVARFFFDSYRPNTGTCFVDDVIFSYNGLHIFEGNLPLEGGFLPPPELNWMQVTSTSPVDVPMYA